MISFVVSGRAASVDASPGNSTVVGPLCCIHKDTSFAHSKPELSTRQTSSFESASE